MAPKLPLVLFALLVLAPLLTLAGLRPELALMSLLAASFLCFIPLIDLAVAFGRHQDLEIGLPSQVRATLGQAFDLEFLVKNTVESRGGIRIAAAYPEMLIPAKPLLNLLFDGIARERIFLLQLVGVARGKTAVQKIYFDWNSPLRFWVFRAEREAHCQIQIFPDLAREGRQLAKFLNRGAVGVRAQRQIGRGREFEKLRTYEPGDGFDSIHWKATAKHRFPVTKVFQLERSQEVYLILDTSRLSGRQVGEVSSGSVKQMTRLTQLDRSISAGLLFCVAAKRQGDLFGLITFSDKVDHLIRPRSGAAHFNFCRNVATGLQPAMVTPDYAEVFSTLRQKLRRRSLLVFLTSLDDPVLSEDFAASAEILAKSHVLLVVMLSPPGLQPLFDQENPRTTEQIYQRLAGHLRWAKLRDLERTLRQKGIQFHVVPNDYLALKMVGFYMDLKRRQVL
jgi:uncharacterized protein (DUF58 family)